MPINYFPLPDARQGSGYVTLRGNMGQSIAGDVWPYPQAVDPEPDDELEDELGSDIDAIAKLRLEPYGGDRLQQLNYKPSAFTTGATRGLSGIMASIEPRELLENFIEETLAGQIGQGSMSYDVMSPAATTRTRPGRYTGSKKGYFSRPPPKPGDIETRADTLEDIASNTDDIKALKHSRIVQKRIRKKNMAQEMKNTLLQQYVREVLGLDKYVSAY